MSTAVEVVVAMLDVTAAGDLGAMAEHLAPDMDYRAIEGALDDAGLLVGPDAYLAYAADWYETFPDLRIDLEEAIAISPEVGVFGERISGRMRGSEAEVKILLWIVVTVRDGKMVRGREYATREEAMAAAGD